MASQDTVIGWLRDLEDGDPDAARVLWQRYFEKLVKLADKRLGHSPRRHFDEEDVALSVFNSLHRCATDGRLVEVANKEDLWRLLVTFTAQKVIDKIRASEAQKRGGGNVRGESVFLRAGEDQVVGFDAFLTATRHRKCWLRWTKDLGLCSYPVCEAKELGTSVDSCNL